MTLDDYNHVVGRRIDCDGHRGTVRFTGEIEGTSPGVWFGIEWDDPSRGKHDGSHKGISYFHVRNATGGSFVRPHKVNLGKSCTEAILSQYEPLQEEKLKNMQRQAIFKANKVQVKTFEFVGFDTVWEKTSQHENLLSIDLRNQQICHGDSSLSNICPNLVELDLKQNLISTWDDLSSITKFLPNLKILNISENRIHATNSPANLVSNLMHITHLIAGNMEWDINNLIDTAKLFPNLISLEIINNNLTTLNSELCTLLPNLQKLSLENNNFKNWNEILKLSELNSLEYLNLKNTEINEIYFDNNVKSFASLKILNISDNKINDWNCISNLVHLLKLEELTFKNNPVLSLENFDTNRQIIICRIDHLKMLDKILITEVEKRGAALDYLKKYGTSYLKAVNDVNLFKEFNETHPCYQRLVDKYGAPEAAELVSGTAKLKHSLVNLKVTCSETKESISKKVPRSMKIQKLRGLLQKHFCPGGTPLNLSYKCQDQPDIKYEFDNDLKDLAYYSIQDGDEVIVAW